MIEITETNYPEFINAPLAVITFSSPWCTSCKKIAASLGPLSEQEKGKVSFGICDISAHPSIPSELQVFSLPTVIVFKAGTEIKRLQAPLSEASVMSALREFL